MKFEEDFDFETANAQFHKDELGKELQNKLKLKGKISSATPAHLSCLPITPATCCFSIFESKTQMDCLWSFNPEDQE